MIFFQQTKASKKNNLIMLEQVWWICWLKMMTVSFKKKTTLKKSSMISLIFNYTLIFMLALKKNHSKWFLIQVHLGFGSSTRSVRNVCTILTNSTRLNLQLSNKTPLTYQFWDMVVELFMVLTLMNRYALIKKVPKEMDVW